MLPAVLACALLFVLVACAVTLLTSKALAERLVSAGMMPTAILGLLPALQGLLRVFGLALITAGLVKIAIDNGWIDSTKLSRYAFSVTMILIGVAVLLLSHKASRK